MVAPDLNNQFNKLAKTIENARAEVELKDDVEQYIDTLAHELRTPITGIQLTAENLLTPMSDEQRKRFIENILDSNKHMDLLVNRLLDLSRIERRETLKAIEPLNILQIVNNVLKAPSRSKNISDKGLNVVLEINNKSLIKAEKILLEQAIGNIVNNALDFSPKSGTVTIKALKLMPPFQLSFLMMGQEYLPTFSASCLPGFSLSLGQIQGFEETA